MLAHELLELSRSRDGGDCVDMYSHASAYAPAAAAPVLSRYSNTMSRPAVQSGMFTSLVMNGR